VYNRQAEHHELSSYLIQSEFQQPPSEGQDFAPFLQKLDVYFDDANLDESRILALVRQRAAEDQSGPGRGEVTRLPLSPIEHLVFGLIP
jgi:hypothetical protein